jgi:hypothetical protein
MLRALIPEKALRNTLCNVNSHDSPDTKIALFPATTNEKADRNVWSDKAGRVQTSNISPHFKLEDQLCTWLAPIGLLGSCQALPWLVAL